jgi:hypothetical protein
LLPSLTPCFCFFTGGGLGGGVGLPAGAGLGVASGYPPEVDWGAASADVKEV